MRHAGNGRSPITLVVADDHPMWVVGVARLAERCALEVLACCVDGHAALDAIVEHSPDVAVLDLRMPGLSGREVLGEVRRRQLRTRVLMCSAHTEPTIVHALISGGARGFVTKTAPVAELCRAVGRVASGGIWLSEELAAAFYDQVACGQRAPSERELEVLRLVAEGLTDRGIGEQLHISHETVRTNLKRLQEKLGVAGRPALVATALRRGLIE
jgi:two-component system nitrate/nitrite response regulator NarL